RGDGGEDRLEERFEVLLGRHPAVLGALQGRPARLGRGVDDREVDLVLGGVEIEEELVRLVDHLGDSGTPGSRGGSALGRATGVCGSAPSLASTSSSTPSTMDSPRSTSPPKSAWPGGSTTLTVIPCQSIAVC